MPTIASSPTPPLTTSSPLPPSSSFVPARHLRQSTSAADIRSAAASGPATRHERRRTSLSVSPSSFHASSLSSSTTYNSQLSVPGQPGKTWMSPPPSPPPPNSKLEETYLAAKRRTHRQSYFEHYPERNSPRLREQRKEANDELDALVSARKEKLSKEKGREDTGEGSSAGAFTTRTVADRKRLENEDLGRPSIRKSISLGATPSSRKPALEAKELPENSSQDVFGQSTIPLPPPRPPRSTKRATQAPLPPPKPPRIHTNHASSSTSHSLRTPKVPTHPYGAFRGEDVPDLRMSNSTYSSSQTHRGSPSPPQTPVEAHAQSSSYEPIEVMVAPISNVEAMDALVDGMDGSSDDDLFQRLQCTVAKDTFQTRHSPRSHQHHPLYAPPLPNPPGGVVMGRAGGGRPKGLRIDDDGDDEDHDEDSTEDDSDEEDGDTDRRYHPASPGRAPFPFVSETLHSEKRRDHENGRTGSSSTILADMAAPAPAPSLLTTTCPNTSVNTSTNVSVTMISSRVSSSTPVREAPMSIDDIIRKHTVKPAHAPSYQRPPSSASTSPSATSSRPSTGAPIPPSISEIIQRHMPLERKASPAQLIGSSISANGNVSRRRQVTSPSPLSDLDSDAESSAAVPQLSASASIDSIGAEALRAHQFLSNIHSSTASHTGSARASNTSFSREEALSRRHSTYSGKMPTTGGGGSIRSGSASASISKGTTHASDQIASEMEMDVVSGLSTSASMNGHGKKKQSAQRDAVATYLRSARITTLLKLTRRPHAAPDKPLTVSVSDLGAKTGLPLVVFLGLGCVRHVMGLYDEMAECMGLRLITIDRWGIGRTDVPPDSSSRGVLEWATVVDEVLEQLKINRCCIMAHSAGSPYALAFANKYPSRIVGDICLLAPWVGGGAGGGYGWLKYVPNGILKTAQAAEWKIQAWMIGKPPKITYEGIGYNMKAPLSSSTYDGSEHSDRGAGARLADFDEADEGSGSDSGYDEDELDMQADEMGVKSIEPGTQVSNNPYPSASQIPPSRSGSAMGKSRPSTSSGNTLAEYDDLADFGGRFGSRTTFERHRSMVGSASIDGHMKRSNEDWGMGKKKKGFLRMWKGAPQSNAGISNNAPPVPPVPAILAGLGPATGSASASSSTSSRLALDPLQTGSKSKLRSLKSIGSLRHRNSNVSNHPRTQSQPDSRTKVQDQSPVLPEQDFSGALDFNLGLDEFSIGKEDRSVLSSTANMSLGRKSTERRDMAFPRRSTMYGEPPVAEHGKEASRGPPPVVGSRMGGRRSISMSTARPSMMSSAQLKLGSATMSGHSRGDSVTDALGTLSSTKSTKSTPSNKLRRRQQQASESASTTSESGATSPTTSSSISYQVELGNALIAASHAESSRGTHPDLLQILNHERRPWGFSYARYPHPVRVWYGDRDERIAKESVEWLKDKMKENGNEGSKCEVKVVKGADHGLMFRTDVVVEVLEYVQGLWNAPCYAPASATSVASPALGKAFEISSREREMGGVPSLGAKLNLSPRKLERAASSEKGASWGYELQNDPFCAF